MLISFFLMMIISTSLTVPAQSSPRFHVEAWFPFRNCEMDYWVFRNGLRCIFKIDHCTVSVAILNVTQSRQKITANVWEVLQLSAITGQILTKNVSLKR